MQTCSYRCGRLSTAVAIEIGPVFFQPFARTLHAAADLARQLPETRTVIHFAQVRGEYQPTSGVVMPTFMPETA